jgi:hypothetical protein
MEEGWETLSEAEPGQHYGLRLRPKHDTPLVSGWPRHY